MRGLIKLLGPLRRWHWLDWLLTRLEAYGALLEQWGLRPDPATIVAAVVAIVMGVWAYLTIPGAAIAAAITIVVFVVLWVTCSPRFLPLVSWVHPLEMDHAAKPFH
jgi:hypothetical protein